jgi:cytochrome c-type protein NapC
MHLSTYPVAAFATACFGAVLALETQPARGAEDEARWNDAQPYTLSLFQPGQSAWEWLLMPANHSAGARRMRDGSSCRSCHEGEERTIGDRVAAGAVLEPSPMPGMPGSFDAHLQIRRDDAVLQLRLSWPSLAEGEAAGVAEFPARVTVMLGSEALPLAAVAGCWASCHVDSPGMPEEHPQQLTKYLPNSRGRMTATGGGTNVRSDEELAEELAQGRFLEYWQVALDDEGVAERLDGYFLEARRSNEEPRFSATARREGRLWIVEMTRPLQAPAGPRLTVEPGVGYTLAVAVHGNHASGRHHYVSWPIPMVVEADAVRLDLDVP